MQNTKKKKTRERCKGVAGDRKALISDIMAYGVVEV